MGKTTIDILDTENWNWVKDRKNQYELPSVSNVIFRMVDDFRSMDLERLVFLKHAEKIYEYEFFDLDEFSFLMNVPKNIAIKLIEKYLGKKVPIYGISDKKTKIKWIKIVHGLMMEIGIVPRGAIDCLQDETVH